MVFVLRQALPHIPPPFVHPGSWFFLTICCAQRSTNQLCVPAISADLLADGAFYHQHRRWELMILLLMPDHLHLIAGFAYTADMSAVIRNWKRLTARKTGVKWQRDYFDHRIRPGEGIQRKAEYIRQNPVRAGLVRTPEEWPHQIDFRFQTRTVEGNGPYPTDGQR